MRRDMDVVRRILAEVSGSNRPLDMRSLADDKHDEREIAYHIDIMIEAGLIKGTIARSASGSVLIATADSLTWKGNEFYDAVADDDVWSTVKKTIVKTIGSASLETVQKVAVQFGTQAVLNQLM